eukprot:scaffold931_cov117-Isochrysis_galbana.AAC.10
MLCPRAMRDARHRHIAHHAGHVASSKACVPVYRLPGRAAASVAYGQRGAATQDRLPTDPRQGQIHPPSAAMRWRHVMTLGWFADAMYCIVDLDAEAWRQAAACPSQSEHYHALPQGPGMAGECPTRAPCPSRAWLPLARRRAWGRRHCTRSPEFGRASRPCAPGCGT